MRDSSILASVTIAISVFWFVTAGSRISADVMVGSHVAQAADLASVAVRTPHEV